MACLSEINNAPKVKRLNEMLQKRFDLQINFAADPDHLREVMEHYDAKREAILSHDSDAAFSNPEYTKAVLISEAVKTFLREIAPKRLRKKKRP